MSSFALQYCFPPDFTSQFSGSAEVYILEIQSLSSVSCLPQKSPQDLELCNFMVTDQACLSLIAVSPANSSEAMNVLENLTSACHVQHLYHGVVHDDLQSFLRMCAAVLPFLQASGRFKYPMRNRLCNIKIQYKECCLLLPSHSVSVTHSHNTCHVYWALL